MEGELKDYRQPMVTSLGILLGFLLSFLAGWAADGSTSIEDTADYVILATIAIAVTILLVVLFRILSATVKADAGSYYRWTLRLYVVGVTFAFGGLWLALLL